MFRLYSEVGIQAQDPQCSSTFVGTECGHGDIEIAGIRVSPGDIVVADETGVCFIPLARAAEVLAKAMKKSEFEEAKCEAIDSGTAVADLPNNA